jgi:hypothetical protein
MNDHKHHMYTVDRDGHYLSIERLGDFQLVIHESKHLKAGESMIHPLGSLILLVVAPIR